MASSKQFWLYTFSLILFSSQLYAGCSLATLKGSYSYQYEIQIQSKQCQISGAWLLDGNGGGWDEMVNNNCPDIKKAKGQIFRYKLGSNCLGTTQVPNGLGVNFQVMNDGTVKLLTDVKNEAIGTLSHSLLPDEIKTIWQGQVNWENNGNPSADLSFNQIKWQKLQAGWRALTFKVLTDCPLTKPQGNYAYQGKFTIGGKPCKGSGNWLFGDTGAGWIQSKTQCPGQTDIIVNKPFRYAFDDNCLATLHVLNGSEQGDNLTLMDDGKLKLTFAGQEKAVGIFNHALTENEANTIQQNLTAWGYVDSQNKWNKLIHAGQEASDTGNFQEAEKKIQAALAEAKANTVAGASWDDLIETGIKAGEAGDYAKAKQQLQAAKALGYVAFSQSLSGLLHHKQDHLKQAGSFYQQCVDTLKSNAPETVHVINFSQQALANDYKESEILYNKGSLVSCLTELAWVRGIEKDYDGAETLYKKAQNIAKKTLPPTNSVLFYTLNAFATFERYLDNYDKAEALQREILVIRQNTLPESHPDIGVSFSEIGDINHAQGRHAEAEENLQNSLDILQKAPPEKQSDFADALLNLSRLYQDQGRYSEAEKLLQQGVEIRRKLLGENHPFTLEALDNLAINYLDQGHARKAEELLRQILEKLRSYPHKIPARIAMSQQSLATIFMHQGRYQEAEKLYLESTAMREKIKSDDASDLATAYKNLGNLYIILGQYGKAESYLKNALVVALKRLPSSHPDVARAMTALADLYITLGQYKKSEPLHQRAFTIRQNASQINNHDIADSMLGIGLLYQQQATNEHTIESENIFEKSEEQYQKAIRLIRKMPSGDNGALLSEALYYLADCYQTQKKNEEAKPLYEESLAVHQKTFSTHNTASSRAKRNLAGIYRDKGYYTEAEALYQEILTWQQSNYPNNPTVAVTLYNMALLYEKTKKYTKAIDSTRQSLDIHNKMSNNNSSNSNTFQNPYMTNNRKNAARLLVRLLHTLEMNSNAEQTTNLPEAFKALQLAHGDQRTQSLQQTALRHSSRDPAIQKKVQDLWNQQTLWQDLDKRYVEMLSKPGQESVAIAKELQIKQQAAEQEIEKLDKALQQDFPAYAQLIHPVPIDVEKVQALLKPDEALLAYLVDENTSYVFVVRPGQAPVLHRLNSGQQALENTVTRLRVALQNPQQDGLKPFNLKESNGLYHAIFKPIEADLLGVKHIFAVTDGALQQLPLHLLVKTAPSSSSPTQHGDYTHADWLARHYAFSYLPAVHSLAYLRGNRNLRQGSHAKAPFIGFGDPLLKEGLISKASQPSEQFQSLGQYVALGGDPSETLRKELARVPQTATALTDIADLLGVTDSTALYLGKLATESQVKQLSDTGRLRQHRIVGFATHALLPAIGESGLVMTPPPEKSDKAKNEADLDLTPALQNGGKDDGYLTAGEAAALDLDADWVLLAACNTATLQGTAEGLSQLSKGFFVAGARSVLASQWPVEANAMQHLTRQLFNDLHEHPTLSRAEALQHSMLKLLDRPANDCNWLCKLGLTNNNLSAHPAYWAPFIILGEGGAIPSATEQAP